MLPKTQESRCRSEFLDYIAGDSLRPLFFCDETRHVLQQLPSESIDCCMTSPPYWGQRQYASTGIGLEDDFREYIANLATIFQQVGRVLKPSGSFWLNIGDGYQNKQLLGLPWRVALELVDKQGWILRNDVIWRNGKAGRLAFLEVRNRKRAENCRAAEVNRCRSAPALARKTEN